MSKKIKNERKKHEDGKGEGRGRVGEDEKMK